MGCCPCCGGKGADLACDGACWDCRGTGCAHEHPCRDIDWAKRPMFAQDADLTVYWPDVRPLWEESNADNIEVFAWGEPEPVLEYVTGPPPA